MSDVHEKAKIALYGYLDRIFEGCTISPILKVDFSNESWVFIDKASKILEKKVNDLDLINCYILLLDTISECLVEIFGYDKLKESKGSLLSLLNDDNLKKLKEKILSFVNDLPLRYFVYVPLPSVGLKDEINVQINSDINIIRLTDEEAQKHNIKKDAVLAEQLASIGKQLEVNKSYLRINASGYANGYSKNPISLETHRIIRELFAALYVFDFINIPHPSFNTKWPRQNMPMLIYTSDVCSDPIQNALSFDVELFLAGLTLTDELYKPFPFPFAFTEKELPQDTNLKPLVKLFNSKSEDSDRIRASLEWYGFSIMTSNETFRFIQAVTAIEALLGEDNKHILSIGEQIGDRCAFLLEQSGDLRRKCKNIFKSIYSTRSKIIHGKSRNLNEEERRHKTQLEDLIKRLLRKEIFNNNNS